MADLYIGIDLGTTNSTVSVIKIDDNEDNPLEYLKTCPIYQYGDMIDHYLMGEECLSSALYFDIENKQVYTGQYAKKMYASGDRPMQTVKSIKTRMGGESILNIPGINDPSQHETFNMVQCASFFIRTIIDSLKKQYPDDDITKEVVVTVPAAFSDDERVATRNAVILGGFKNCIILDEPTAALLSYLNSGIDMFDTMDEDDVSNKLVYDIGGGTLDVSIAKVQVNEDDEYEITTLGLSKRKNLGGDDFDQLLGAYFLKEFEATNEPIEKRSIEDQGRIIARIVSNAEAYKIKLNERINACDPDNVRKLQNIKVRVTFELIDQMYVNGISINKELLDDLYRIYTNPHTGGLMDPIKSALRDAHLTKNDIDEVILTGGMANFYLVKEALQGYFGNDIPLNYVEDTRTSVSRGAALYHWSLNEYNEAEDVKKLHAISQRMATNIYLRKDGEFQLLISSDLNQKNGSFSYIITDDNMTSLPLFLYSGTEPAEGENNEAEYIQLTGKIIPLSHPYEEGEEIPLSWSIDDNKVITIQLEEKDIQPVVLSRLITANQVAEDITNAYIVNKG